jgi:bifunctional non-homologous end joining protein LigD
MRKLKETARLIKEKPLDDAQTVWVEPRLVCEVQYASKASTGLLREPVFLRMRPDVLPEDCQDDVPAK